MTRRRALGLGIFLMLGLAATAPGHGFINPGRDAFRRQLITVRSTPAAVTAARTLAHRTDPSGLVLTGERLYSFDQISNLLGDLDLIDDEILAYSGSGDAAPGVIARHTERLDPGSTPTWAPQLVIRDLAGSQPSGLAVGALDTFTVLDQLNSSLYTTGEIDPDNDGIDGLVFRSSFLSLNQGSGAQNQGDRAPALDGNTRSPEPEETIHELVNPIADELMPDATVAADLPNDADLNVSSIPEPASLLLVGSGLAWLASRRRRS